MPRTLLWVCDGCGRQSQGDSNSSGWLVVKEFVEGRGPRFRAFCGWACLSSYALKQGKYEKGGTSSYGYGKEKSGF